MTKGILLILTATILLVGGCLKMEGFDPNTGKPITNYQIDPNTIAAIEKIAEQAQTITTTTAMVASAVTPVFPWAATAAGVATTVAGILGAGLATWAKIKPKLTTAQSKAEMYYNSMLSIITVVDDFKVKYPTEWAKLKEQFVDAIGPNVENVIRALRGLPAKT